MDGGLERDGLDGCGKQMGPVARWAWVTRDAGARVCDWRRTRKHTKGEGERRKDDQSKRRRSGKEAAGCLQHWLLGGSSPVDKVAVGFLGRFEMKRSKCTKSRWLKL